MECVCSGAVFVCMSLSEPFRAEMVALLTGPREPWIRLSCVLAPEHIKSREGQNRLYCSNYYFLPPLIYLTSLVVDSCELNAHT